MFTIITRHNVYRVKARNWAQVKTATDELGWDVLAIERDGETTALSDAWAQAHS